MSEDDTKIFKIRIKGTVEAVWREITKTDEVQGVMFNMRLHSSLVVGEPIRLRSPDGKYTGIVGDVTELEPMQRYGHTFKFTQYDEPGCTVIHEIEDLGNGEVEYRMICKDMAPGTKTTKQMTQGGDMILKNLKTIIETGKLPLSTRVLYQLFGLMAPFSPKSTLTENWP